MTLHIKTVGIACTAVAFIEFINALRWAVALPVAIGFGKLDSVSVGYIAVMLIGLPMMLSIILAYSGLMALRERPQASRPGIVYAFVRIFVGCIYIIHTVITTTTNGESILYIAFMGFAAVIPSLILPVILIIFYKKKGVTQKRKEKGSEKGSVL